MKEDKFLKVMEENVDKWLKAQLNINVFGKTLSTTLDYLSILYKEERDELQCFLNGIPDEKPNISFNNGFSIFTLVGDKKQGYGCARSARDSFPKDASLLGKLMQESLDLATKSAISFYLTAVGKNVIYDEDLFVKLSKETPETFLSKSSCSLKVDDSVRKMVKDFTEEMYSSGTVNESDGVIHIVNGSNRFVDSEGRKIRESRKLGTIGLEGKFNHSDGSLLNHFDNYVFTNKVDQEKLKTVMQNFYETVNELKVASVPVSKQYPVIFGGSALGTMIHEALGGHLLSGRYIQNKISTVFKNRIGSLVLPEFMTIIDNPQLKDSFGFYLFDDEGVASKKTVLIKNGVLQNYLLDRGSANYFGMNSNGHSRMEWVCRRFTPQGAPTAPQKHDPAPAKSQSAPPWAAPRRSTATTPPIPRPRRTVSSSCWSRRSTTRIRSAFWLTSTTLSRTDSSSRPARCATKTPRLCTGLSRSRGIPARRWTRSSAT